MMNRRFALVAAALALATRSVHAATTPVARAGAAAKAAAPAAPGTAAAPKAETAPVALLPQLSVAQILERNAAARGGLAQWRAVKAITFSGQLEAGGKKEMMLPFTLTLQRPDKSRLELVFEEQTAVQVYDGRQGWKVRPFLNRNEVEAYTPAETKQAANWDELDGPLIDHARKGISVEAAGVDAVDGRSAYKLKLTTKDGGQRFLWVDGQTFLEAKIDGEPRKLDGHPHKVAILYRDYRVVSGLNVPHTLETVVAGVKESHTMTIKTVVVNAPLADTAFTKPQLTAVVSQGR